LVNSDAADSSTPQADATKLPIQSVSTESELEHRTDDVPIPVVATALNQVHHENETLDMSLIIPVVEKEIPHERLPNTSIHVQEKNI